MNKSWISLAMGTAQLAAEAQQVIGLRFIKIAAAAPLRNVLKRRLPRQKRQ